VKIVNELIGVSLDKAVAMATINPTVAAGIHHEKVRKVIVGGCVVHEVSG
jgi:hypothetical protein